MNRFCQIFDVKSPIIQAGMIWCSGWKLASACSNEGILGVIGSGSMYPEVLEEHLTKCKRSTDKPFAVNLPLIYPQVDDHIELIEKHKVPIVITSAGNPAKWTARFKDSGIKVIHVVSSRKFAMKAELAGVDAIVAEGFEAGGHNGREETTTLCLIPDVRKAISVPLIAAGGIGSGRAMLACLNLGADAVQIGSRFVASEESSAHQAFKAKVLEAKEGDTSLTLKELTPVRLLDGSFAKDVREAYQRKADPEELAKLLGRGRAKKGMFEGNLQEGELEIGQISSMIDDIRPAAEIIHDLLLEFQVARDEQFTAERYMF
ncbi:MAG: nitronate monooxygenase [Bacteroidetes bacterium]|nr:nitronate monooxygenase [Bacteroidota bacterium]MDA0973033.1 nitronate monooxygenase [Bacteroidota bacterium]